MNVATIFSPQIHTMHKYLNIQNMKTVKIVSAILLIFLTAKMNAQEIIDEATTMQTGQMNATITHNLGYTEDGVERPYLVTIRKQRTTIGEFEKSDLGKIDQDLASQTEIASVLITIDNPNEATDNRVIALRYEKKASEELQLTAISNGFSVQVGNKKMNYIIGEGISFPNLADRNHLKVEEFDVVE